MCLASTLIFTVRACSCQLTGAAAVAQIHCSCTIPEMLCKANNNRSRSQLTWSERQGSPYRSNVKTEEKYNFQKNMNSLDDSNKPQRSWDEAMCELPFCKHLVPEETSGWEINVVNSV